MPSLYTVSQAAKLLGTSPTTTRRLADEFADHLPDYKPEKGVSRQLSDGDLRTIYAIQSRLQASPALTRAALLAELATPGSEPIVTPATLPTANPQEGKESPETSQATQTDVDTLPNAIAPFLQTQASIERKIETLSAAIAEIQSRPAPENQPENRQTWVFPIAVVLIASLLSAGFVVSAYLQDSRAVLLTGGAALIVSLIALVLPSLRR